MKVVVIGGGIAGLAAARRLDALGVDAAVVEREEVPGGKIRTERTGGFVVEAAPDSFLTRKERGVGLCQELGLGHELIERRPENRRTFVRRGHELHPLPEGLTGAIPASLEALERSELLSDQGKRRFAAEPEAPVAEGEEDESIAAFVSRRFGPEAYEMLVEPLLTGIYGGDGEQLSLQSTFPQLRALELEHGSVLEGLPRPATGGRGPFVSLRSGMDLLVTSLVEQYSRTRVLTGTLVERVSRAGGGYEVAFAGGDSVAADGVVLAAPAHTTAELLGELDADLASAHAEIPHSSSVVTSLAFSRDEVTPLDGYGYVVPRVEGSDVLACTWSSQKWAARAPADAVLVRVYAGRYGGRDLTRESDGELVALARDELRLRDLVADPILTRVHRWPRGMPQYVLGHPERLRRIEERLSEHPGLALAGAAYRGVGIPDCIRSGEEAAEAVVGALARYGARPS